MENTIIGKYINNIKIADDNKAILFQFKDEDDIVLKVDGDCCSQSWIESVKINAEFPALVTNTFDSGAEEHGNRDEYESLLVSIFTIETETGDIIIDYRNSSNGYYSGGLSWPWDSYFYGGVFGQNISTENWIDIPNEN